MMLEKNLLLTGGTGKFGSIIIPHLLKKGWNVLSVSRENQEPVVKSVGVEEKSGSLSWVKFDLGQINEFEDLIQLLDSQELRITHLINNARNLETLAVDTTGKTTPEKFLGELKLDVIAPYELSAALASSSYHRLKNVINIGSMYGLVAPNPNLYEGSLSQSPIQYGTAKAALHHITKELAVRFSGQNIRVNCIAYGGLEGRASNDFKDRYAKLSPSGRMLSESEIIGPIEFLMSDSSSAVNGHTLIADGGWTLW